MRYTLTLVSGPARRIFKEEVAYDDREITRLAKKGGLYVTRPNGSSNIRGSSRLIVWKLNRRVARFQRQGALETQPESPIKVATIRGQI